jgi:zinc finger HIT domain-containing protein 1
MATGPLRFRTPHIEELPTTQTRQAPGFAWVAVAGAQQDPAKHWGTTNRKRARATIAGQTDSQKEALSARQQREIERKIRELNSDNSKDVQIPIPKKEGGGGPARAGKTTNTKKILASGKTFAHYLDDEEAEIARTGRRDGDVEVAMPAVQQRPSKTPITRRKPREESSVSSSPAPAHPPPPLPQSSDAMDLDADDGDDAVTPLPSDEEIEALLNAPPLTYNQARAAPPPANAPPPRRFCEVCGYFGRAKCMKCGAMTCSVLCKDTHDEQRCLKFYA